MKVKAGLSYGPSEAAHTSKGIEFSDDFVNRVIDWEEEVRARIILKINEVAGDNWHVFFTPYPIERPTIFADITAPDEHLRAIIQIISEAFPEYDLQFWKPAPYLKLWERPARVA